MPRSVAAEVLLVSKSPCGCAMCAKKFTLRGLVWARARKSSPCKPKMAEKRCFQVRRANFFAEMPLEALCWATYVAVVLVVLAVGLRHPRRELRWVQCPWHCGVRAVDNEARASCRPLGGHSPAGNHPQPAAAHPNRRSVPKGLTCLVLRRRSHGLRGCSRPDLRRVRRRGRVLRDRETLCVPFLQRGFAVLEARLP